MKNAISIDLEDWFCVHNLAGAIKRALAVVKQGRPALLDVLVTPEAVSSDAKSGLAWVPDLQPLAAWDQAERRWRASAG